MWFEGVLTAIHDESTFSVSNGNTDAKDNNNTISLYAGNFYT